MRGLAAAACTICFLIPLAHVWAAPKLRAFGVESVPPGAEVFTITGRVGTTPAFVSERDIYPNTYPEQKVDQYGLVILRREGCQEYRKRITIDDINKGVKATLVCEAEPGQAASVPLPASAAAASPARRVAPPVAETPRPGADQRLRWLRTIEELREHQLLSEEEERRIRRRILDRDR